MTPHRTLIVTGGAGFIGSALVRHLVHETDCRVVNVDSLTYAGNLSSLGRARSSTQHRLERVDVRDPGEVRRVFREHDPDGVLHLAAESHVDRSIDGPAAFLETNVLGTHNVLEASLNHFRSLSGPRRDAFRFLHVSTDEVFGSADEGVLFTEETPYAPNSPYAASKAAADHFVRAWGRTYGLPVLTTNCSNNYGPYQFPEKLIPHMVLTALEGRDLPVYGDGLQVRDWLHVSDHVRALLTVLGRAEPGSYFNIGGQAERTNIAVVQEICDVLDQLRPRSTGSSYSDQISFVEDRPGHDRRYAIDSKKIETELGWRPSIEFEEGLRQTVIWYLENDDWWGPIREGSYEGERLGKLK